MPLIDVTYDETCSELQLRRFAELLPAILAEALDCSDDPHHGPPEPGDIEIRFHAKGPLDIGDLNCVVEVRTRMLPSREQNADERCELIRRLLSEHTNLGKIGVWLVLLPGAWSQD